MITPSKDVSSVNGSTNFVHGKNYFLYDRTQTNKNANLYHELLSKAETQIVIWEPHYSMNSTPLFCDVEKDGIKVEVLTMCDSTENKRDIQAFAGKILSSIDKGKVKNCKVKVYALQRREYRKYPAVEWHDRFLMVDNEVYLVGASMDSHSSVSQTYGIKRLTETEDKNLVIDAYIRHKHTIKDESTGRGNGFIVEAKRGSYV